MAEVYDFGVPVTCHAWNKDRTQIALSPKNAEVYIYHRSENGWDLVHVLQQHDLRVTGIDWGAETNRIVTCAADRNAYVWTYDDASQKWKPTLVLLRMNRAATCVRWSPLENKFAVGSGSRLISLCYYEKENNWWASKHIKKGIKSTITSISWHPNNILLAAGSTDFVVRIYSTFIKDIEDKPGPTIWGAKMPLGQLMQEYSDDSAGGGGWIHDLSFDATGSKLVWVSHDSTVSLVDADSDINTIFVNRTIFMPFVTVVWTSSDDIFAAGHDCVPVRFRSTKSSTGAVLETIGEVDQKTKESNAKNRCNFVAKNKFQQRDKMGRDGETEADTLSSLHKNTITCIQVHTTSKDKVTKLSTSSLDGNLIIWNLA